jgi:predicted ATPase
MSKYVHLLCTNEIARSLSLSCSPSPCLSMFNLTVVRRDGQLRALHEAYNTTALIQRSQQQFVLLSGQAGTGNSSLVQELGRHLTNDNGLYCYGKFEQYQQNQKNAPTEPYSAISQACQDLITGLLRPRQGILASKSN